MTAPVTGAEVRYATRAGETFDGYLTCPDGGAEAPGILLITAIFGVDREMRELADAWARDGFIVSVPDIFWRQTPGPTADVGVALDRYGKFDPLQGMRDIEDLVRDLKSRPRCNGKVAILGFCFGGRYALLGAARLGIDAAGSFHGAQMGKHVDEVDRVTCPVSFHFGATDPVVPMEEVRAIQEAFAGRPDADIGVYGAGHNFAMPRKIGYDAAAARESRDRVLSCFRAM
jgi:carboxymethylenebutenolidase